MQTKKKIGIVLGTFVAVILISWGVIFGIVRYNRWRSEDDVRKTAEALELFEKEDFERAMADTVGGKTPQETLDLFIAAVEAGNYELASKYFIGSKQEEWRENLRNIVQTDKKKIFLDPIKESKNSVGEYNLEKDKYFIEEPISIDFRLYPNGSWKIVEI